MHGYAFVNICNCVSYCEKLVLGRLQETRRKEKESYTHLGNASVRALFLVWPYLVSLTNTVLPYR